MTDKYDPDIHHRKSIRLKGYDYSQTGAYFINICVEEKECLFGNVVDGKMLLNGAGNLVKRTWEALPERFPMVSLDIFVVMPNHLHAILMLYEIDGVNAPTLGDVMRAFKSISARDLNRLLSRQGQRLWQRNYYERIIRNEKELVTCRQYIEDNPVHWEEAKEDPDRWIMWSGEK